MRTKVWNTESIAAPSDDPELTDRVQALLDQMAGGEGGGTPCTVGVPPWFLKAAHARLNDLTRDTRHEGFVEEVFSEEATAEPSVHPTVSPDKLALALLAIDDVFVADIRRNAEVEASKA
jgi:hypothetical protein